MENSKQPAFAVSGEMCEVSKIETYPFGLTKREYISSHNLAGLLANGMTTQEGVCPPYATEIESVVKLAIRGADELLRQLSDNNNESQITEVDFGTQFEKQLNEFKSSVFDIWQKLKDDDLIKSHPALKELEKLIYTELPF